MNNPEIFENFNPIKSCNLAAGLLVDKRFHSNTYRVEKLIHLTLAHCKGNKTPSSKVIQSWINDFSPISSSEYLEDPVEDVFTSNIYTEWGDFRIYEGIWEANDFHLQIVLDTLKDIPERYNPKEFFEPIKALLSLSEEVAKRNNVKPFQIAESNDKKNIHVPKNETLRRLAKSLSFSEKSQISLGLSKDNFRPFIFNLDSKENLKTQEFGNTDLERCPILLYGNKLILALPTAVSAAIRRYIFEWLFQKRLINNFEKLFTNEYVNFIHKIPILGKRIPSNLPLTPKNIYAAYFFEFMAEIEQGRFLQVIVIVDSLHKYFEEGLDVPHPLWKKHGEEIRKRIDVTKDKYSSKVNFRDGLTLIVSAGYGRPYPIILPKTPSNWRVEAIFAHDLETMEWIPGSSEQSLWQLLCQQKKCEDLGINFFNLNGLLNLYGWWEQSDHMLIPDDVEISHGPIEIYLPTDCLAEIRKKTRSASNIHNQIYIDKTFKRVRRKNTSSYFKEDKLKNLYVSFADINPRQLLGCMVSKTRPWWVRLENNEYDLDSNTAYKIWESLLNWMERIAPVLDETYRNKLLGPILFELDISTLPSYQYLPENPPQDSENLMDLEVIPQKNTIKIKLKEPFLYYLNTPENKSEKDLVKQSIKGFFNLAQQLVSNEDIEAICRSIVPNENARHIHFFRAHSFRDQIRHFDKCNYEKISKFDAAFIKIGLGHAEEGASHQEFIGKKNCTNFLNNIVKISWEKLKGQLATFNRESIITANLRNIEGIGAEKIVWERTARAVLSLHENKEDVFSSRMKHFTKLYV